MNIPGTSYWSPISGGNSILDSGSAAFGVTGLGNYPGFPSGAAPIAWGFGMDTSYDTSGTITGGASSLYSASSIGGSVGLNAAAYGAGVATQGIETQAQLNAIRTQLQDNQNADCIKSAIQGLSLIHI